jgi:hypothetical protein
MEHSPATPDPPGSPSDATTLTDVLAVLARDGFGADLTVASGGRVRDVARDITIDAGALELHHLRRLEGASDPADMVAVAAVSGPDGLRGALVLRFGPEATEDEATVLEVLGR